MTETPARLCNRPRDERGYVIPFVTYVHPETGLPDFRVLCLDRLGRCLPRRLCGMCGQPLGKHIFFIGGPLCVSNGYFYDPPMHRECALYALQACPHLARAKGRLSPPSVVTPAGVKIIVGDIAPDKAAWFGLMHTTDYSYAPDSKGMMLIKAQLPWLEVERWRDGSIFYE